MLLKHTDRISMAKGKKKTQTKPVNQAPARPLKDGHVVSIDEKVVAVPATGAAAMLPISMERLANTLVGAMAGHFEEWEPVSPISLEWIPLSVQREGSVGIMWTDSIPGPMKADQLLASVAGSNAAKIGPMGRALKVTQMPHRETSSVGRPVGAFLWYVNPESDTTAMLGFMRLTVTFRLTERKYRQIPPLASTATFK